MPETYYSVAFDDGTFCDNHDPEEVKYEQGAELTINTEVQSTDHMTVSSLNSQHIFLALVIRRLDNCKRMNNCVSRFV